MGEFSADVVISNQKLELRNQNVVVKPTGSPPLRNATPEEIELTRELNAVFKSLLSKKLDLIPMKKVESLKNHFDSYGKLSSKQIKMLQNILNEPAKVIHLSERIRLANFPTAPLNFQVFDPLQEKLDSYYSNRIYPCLYRGNLGLARNEGFIPTTVIDNGPGYLPNLMFSSQDLIKWGSDFEVPRKLTALEIMEFLKANKLWFEKDHAE